MHKYAYLLILLCFIREIFMQVPFNESTSSEGSVDLEWYISKNPPVMAMRKCLDLCHLKYFQYFPCLLENGTYADSPTTVCQENYCEAENVEHIYVTKTDGTSWITHINRINKTKVGEKATFRDVCLDSEGLPKKRLCMGKSLWEPLNNLTCYQGSELNIKLNNLINQITTGEQNRIMELRKELSKSRGKLTPIDIFNIGNMFAYLMDQQENKVNLGSELVGICMEVMSSSSEVLKLSGELNSTNVLLSKFEEYMDALAPQMVPSENCARSDNFTIVIDNNETSSEVESVNLGQNGVYSLISGNLSVFFVNPECNHITGIAIYTQSSPELHESSNEYWYRFLQWNESLEHLKQESHLEMATYIPQILWSQLKEEGANFVIFKIYSHDSLFVETVDQRRRRPLSKILSISIHGFKDLSLPQVLPFLLRNENHRQPDQRVIHTGSGCGYWNYKTWLSDGVTTCNERNVVNDPLITCYAHHLTQFTFLLGVRSIPSNYNLLTENLHYMILDYITIIGCCLSLVGLSGIFVMALVFKTFRDSASTKVLLHLCAALTLQTLLFIIVNIDNWIPNLRYFNVCLLFGALMHYSVLVAFIWMLIIALLQYQRYVIVLGVQRPQRYILISSLLAWIVPFLVILSIVLASPSLYKPYENPNPIKICYPTGNLLLLSVVLPIVVITLANVFMVGYIIYSIHTRVNLYDIRHRIFQELKLFVLLFFLLGLPWIFGLCNYIQFGITFSYLFCLTATLQGFVLFVYFCLFNKTNRKLFLSLFGYSHESANESGAVLMELSLRRRSNL